MTKYRAIFIPEAWINDYAVEVDPQGPTEWDCTAEVLGHPDYWADQVGERLAYGDANEAVAWAYPGVLDYDDMLKGDPNAPAWVRDWTGPFTIRVFRAEVSGD